MESIRTIFFSKDRPLQLEAAIMSAGTMGKTSDIVNEVSYVLYKASTPEFKKAYKILEKRYPFVLFVEEENFKKVNYFQSRRAMKAFYAHSVCGGMPSTDQCLPGYRSVWRCRFPVQPYPARR